MRDLTQEDVLSVINDQWLTLSEVIGRVKNRYGQDIGFGQIDTCLRELVAKDQVEKSLLQEPGKSCRRYMFRRTRSGPFAQDTSTGQATT